MRKTLIIAALAVLAMPATAQKAAKKPEENTWIYVPFSNGAMAWNLHAGRWNTAGDTIEGQRLLYFSPPQVVDGLSVVWKQDFWTIACPANTMQIKSGEELSASLIPLFDISLGQPYAIQPGTSDYYLKLVYCDNKMLEGGKDVKGLLAVMEAMSKPPPQ